MKGKFGSANHNSRPIVMCDLKGVKIKRFDAIMTAEREIGILNSNIVACLKGRHKTAGGYKWIYDESR
jgi:hypothetical protein